MNRMSAYRFVIHKNGARTEELGFMSLADDVEALAFGKQVIRDMEHKDAYGGWTMDILEGKRTVGAITL
jgi:hypothetical protein